MPGLAARACTCYAAEESFHERTLEHTAEHGLAESKREPAKSIPPAYARLRSYSHCQLQHMSCCKTLQSKIRTYGDRLACKTYELCSLMQPSNKDSHLDVSRPQDCDLPVD